MCSRVINQLHVGFFTDARRALNWLNGSSEANDSKLFLFRKKDEVSGEAEAGLGHGEDIRMIRVAYAESKLSRVPTNQK